MNLIICCTPLQVLIAEKIIERYPNQAFFGVMLHTVENAKFDFYKQRLKAQCRGGFFSMLQHNDRLSLFKEILALKRQFSGKQFEQAFVANFPELHIQFLLSSVKFTSLNTFDDGTVNIVKNSPFLRDDPNTFLRKTVNFLLGNRYSTRKLRELSQAHFTIYGNFPNIIANTVEINLLDNNIITENNEEVVNILLGQPVYADDSKNIALAERVIERFDIQRYLPHPREKYHIQNVEYIETPFIFEEYIQREFADKKCRVYTYFSSAILNIVNKSPNVEVIALRVETNEPAFNACYELFEQVGIPVIDIRE